MEEEDEEGMELGVAENEISIHALVGNRAKTILKIVGVVKKRKLTVLIDSGSTHSFLDYDTARELNCKRHLHGS